MRQLGALRRGCLGGDPARAALYRSPDPKGLCLARSPLRFQPYQPAIPAKGRRFRLKAGFEVCGFSPQVQVILNALKRYGMMLSDNGSA
jgi:hypothetical protein